MKNYFVYIIQSTKTNKFYTGLTSSLSRRLNEHDKGVKSTKTTYNKGPFKLIHAESHETLAEARKNKNIGKVDQVENYAKN